MRPHGRTHLPNKAVFVCARFCVSRPLGNSKISQRAPRSGKAATLRTHQVGSRHAGCATPGAFRHRKHAHERRARAPLCQLIRRSAVPACMKRSGAGLPLCTWSGCGGRLNEVAFAIAKPVTPALTLMNPNPNPNPGPNSHPNPITLTL